LRVIESSSRRFIEAIDPNRDAIYVLAVRAVGESQAEMVLQKAIRSAFRAYIQNGEKLERSPEGIVEWMDGFVRQQAENSTATPEPVSGNPPPVMPADAWARTAAAVQIEAALLGGTAERSMLAYDPLLAPKKKASGNDELVEGLGFDPWTRFVFAAAIVLIFGIVATIVLMTHHTPLPATSEPATAPAVTPSAADTARASP
jgi:hypothetical protein